LWCDRLEWAEWQDFYAKIAQEFSYQYDEDRKARDFLAKYISSDINDLAPMISKKQVVICGAGPTLVSKLADLNEKQTVIACDGTTSALLEYDLIADIIVTDLDGIVEDIIKSNSLGSKIVVHAHGDNLRELERYIDKFKQVYGTTQIEPKANISNFGGLTDGDRAVFLAEHFKPKEVILIGMDFNSDIGEYSYTKNVEVKKKKLKWASYLINYLKEKSDIPIQFG